MALRFLLCLTPKIYSILFINGETFEVGRENKGEERVIK